MEEQLLRNVLQLIKGNYLPILLCGLESRPLKKLILDNSTFSSTDYLWIHRYAYSVRRCHCQQFLRFDSPLLLIEPLSLQICAIIHCKIVITFCTVITDWRIFLSVKLYIFSSFLYVIFCLLCLPLAAEQNYQRMDENEGRGWNTIEPPHFQKWAHAKAPPSRPLATPETTRCAVVRRNMRISSFCHKNAGHVRYLRVIRAPTMETSRWLDGRRWLARTSKEAGLAKQLRHTRRPRDQKRRRARTPVSE